VPLWAVRRLCDTLDVIRPYTDEDLADVLDVWYLASSVSHSFLSDDFFDTERQQIADQWLPASETSVFETDGRLVGSVSMIGNEVGGIFVTPEYQSRGVGGVLLDHVAASR
jgi:putative acetyltransferase